jgi:hypothetical protein
MFKFLLLAGLFVAFVPGVLVTLDFGFKNKFVPILIHAAIFAFIYSAVSHCYWMHMKHRHHRMMRHLNQDLMNEVQMEKLDQLQLNQMMQNDMLSALSTKCSGGGNH